VVSFPACWPLECNKSVGIFINFKNASGPGSIVFNSRHGGCCCCCRVPDTSSGFFVGKLNDDVVLGAVVVKLDLCNCEDITDDSEVPRPLLAGGVIILGELGELGTLGKLCAQSMLEPLQADAQMFS